MSRENKDRNIVVRILDWVKNAIAKLGMSKEERAMRKDLEKLENLLSNALKSGTGGRPLEDVEKTARAAEKAHLEDELKKKKAAQTEETEEQAVAKNATPALARAKINIDNKGKTSYNNKRSYYSQFNTLATRWASKAEKGELFAGYDGNNYKIVIATGDDYLYESYKTIYANNEAMIEYYEEFIKENNERIQRESQEVRKIAESITLDEGFYDNYSSLTTRKSSNGSNGRVFEGEPQRNGERNTEEGSGNQRGLKGGRASLAVDSAGNTLTTEQAEYFKDSKVRDENGNLLVVYHGTRKADFAEFKRNVNYFTDSSEMADSYAPSSEKYVGYLDIKKLIIIDAKGEKWSRVPIDAKTKEFLEKYGASTFKENGKWRTSPADIASAIESGIDEGELDYDGIIIENVDDIGRYWKTRDNIVANDYITFKSNQFKNTTNKTPTKNADIRYSIDTELAKKTSDRVQTVVKVKEKKSVKETWDAIMKELKYSARAS